MDSETTRTVVVSSDTHAGADLRDYLPYLPNPWHDDFDRWARDFINPFESEHLLTNDPSCNWDTSARVALLESQGVVGEVIFPNTVPPFFPQTQFFVPPPPKTRDEYEHRWAGLQAHNRWLRDFCDLLPGRRAGVAQIMLEDIDAAVAEIKWVHEVGLKGGILMPGGGLRDRACRRCTPSATTPSGLCVPSAECRSIFTAVEGFRTTIPTR